MVEQQCEGTQCHWIVDFRVLKDFPGDPEVKNLPANAGDVGLIPSLGTKILHGSEQLGLCTTITEACMPRDVWRKSEHRKEDPAQPKINEQM